ncbi:MAG: pantoate--beta-alanine ligase [Tahibacter sp.]
MRICSESHDVQAQVRDWRAQGLRVALVPTMGNLHAGHYSLLELARQHADRVVASIFVNPTQFGPNEDFSRYPRTLEQDSTGLAEQGCHLLFAPSIATLYPNGSATSTEVHVPVVTEVLEGEFRPGHFVGVASVVARLFLAVSPDVAIFGQKDYQQLLTIRRMVQELGFPIEIVAAPTQREANGLAMSSRNQYLSVEERARAATLFSTLQSMRTAIHGSVPVGEVEQSARDALTRAGFSVDYIVLRDAVDLSPAIAPDRPLVALVAARLGKTRLIDNLTIDADS